MENQQNIIEHYGTSDLTKRVAQCLDQTGLGDKTLKWSDLAPLDQFHIRGAEATAELANDLRLKPGATVLDVGCGLGGPARYLAAEFGCRVTGIDLSRSFIDIARMLTARTDLPDSVTFRQGDALDLPFSDAEFDFVWTQHVAMNIADRRRFYENIRRVLKPGGQLAIYDVVAGDGKPLIFPVPWARGPENSFLLFPGEMREMLKETGFIEIKWTDTSDSAIKWFAGQRAAQKQLKTQPDIGIQVVMGAEFLEMAANLGQNLADGRVKIIEAILRRDLNPAS